MKLYFFVIFHSFCLKYKRKVHHIYSIPDIKWFCIIFNIFRTNSHQRFNDSAKKKSDNQLKIVKSSDDLEAEASNLPDDDKTYKMLKRNIDSVLEACAHVQKVSREVYTQQNEETGKKELREFNFTIGRIFMCSICKGELMTDKECKRYVLTVH